MIYFTADTHFGSKRTLELSKRPFKDTDEMDNYIIKHCVCILFVGIGLFLSTTFTNKYIPWLLGKGIYKNNK